VSGTGKGLTNNEQRASANEAGESKERLLYLTIAHCSFVFFPNSSFSCVPHLGATQA